MQIYLPITKRLNPLSMQTTVMWICELEPIRFNILMEPEQQ